MYSNPFSNAVQIGLMAFEAQTVITMRLWGMAGLWSTTPAENERMVTEKLHAFAQSAQKANAAMMRGGSPDAVLAAAVKPVRKVTRANARRLTKSGPKLF